MKKAIIIGIVLCALSTYVYFTKILPARQYDPVVRGYGTIEATQVAISPKLPARIATISVREGDRVTQGQSLVTLDCRDLAARRTQTEAQSAQSQAVFMQARAGSAQAQTQIAPLLKQRDQAERDFQRNKKLMESNSIPTSTFEKIETAFQSLTDQVKSAEAGISVAQRAVAVAGAQVKLAQTAVDQVMIALEECDLKAPISGRISARNYEPGEMALPGATLLKMSHTDEAFVWIYIPNKEMGRVKLGQKVSLSADALPKRQFEGEVVHINDEAEFTPKSVQTKEDRTRLVYGVKVHIQNRDGVLLPGMPVEAALKDATQ